jgi:hypothetical protein
MLKNYFSDYNLAEISQIILAKFAAKKTVESQQVARWLTAYPDYIVRMAIDELVAAGSLVEYWAGPPRRERAYLCQPENFPAGQTVWLLRAAPDIAKKLDYTLTSFTQQRVQNRAKSQRESELATQKAEAWRAEREAEFGRQEAAALLKISTAWQQQQYHALLFAYKTQAENSGKGEARLIHLKAVPYQLARRKEAFYRTEYQKLLNRPIPPGVLADFAPGEPEPEAA